MIVVHTMTWSAGECVVTYTDEKAVKDVAGYPVLRMNQLVLPADHPSYDQIGEINAAVQELVRDVTEDWEGAEQYRVEDDGEDDDEVDD